MQAIQDTGIGTGDEQVIKKVLSYTIIRIRFKVLHKFYEAPNQKIIRKEIPGTRCHISLHYGVMGVSQVLHLTLFLKLSSMRSTNLFLRYKFIFAVSIFLVLILGNQVHVYPADEKFIMTRTQTTILIMLRMNQYRTKRKIV